MGGGDWSEFGYRQGHRAAAGVGRHEPRADSRRRPELASASVQIEWISLDLEQPDVPQRLFEFTQSNWIQPDLLVNSAGFGVYGEFRKMDLARQLAMVQVNCAAVVGRLACIFRAWWGAAKATF